MTARQAAVTQGSDVLSDAMVSAESSIPAYVIAKSENLLEFRWLVEMVSKHRKQRLRIYFLSKEEARNFFFVGLAEKHAPFLQ